jgi:hypothetical protein
VLVGVCGRQGLGGSLVVSAGVICCSVQVCMEEGVKYNNTCLCKLCMFRLAVGKACSMW